LQTQADLWALATRCNTLQCTILSRSSKYHTTDCQRERRGDALPCPTHCNTLQHTATQAALWACFWDSEASSVLWNSLPLQRLQKQADLWALDVECGPMCCRVLQYVTSHTNEWCCRVLQYVTHQEKWKVNFRSKLTCEYQKPHKDSLMRLTRLRADSRGTPTARGRQCRMSKERTRGEWDWGIKNKNTHNTQINLNKQKLGEP